MKTCSPALRQSKHQPQDQDSKVDTLPRMSNDAKPGTAKRAAWESKKHDPMNDAAGDAPRLMKMIETKQQPIHHPIPFAKDPLCWLHLISSEKNERLPLQLSCHVTSKMHMKSR